MTKQQLENAYAEKVRQVDEIRELYVAEVTKCFQLQAALAEEKATINRYQIADDAAAQLLDKAKMTLEVPAAEYVPAMSDAWDLIELALGKIR